MGDDRVKMQAVEDRIQAIKAERRIQSFQLQRKLKELFDLAEKSVVVLSEPHPLNRPSLALGSSGEVASGHRKN